jgi:putative transposase
MLQTTQHVIKQYCKSSFQFKKPKLKWRSAKHSLGWIPCTNQNLKFNTNSGMFKYTKLNFRTWYDRPVQGKILSCSMSADSRGRWYVNIITDYEDKRNCGVRQIGIDLGVKDIITCSDGTKYSRINLTNHYAERLAISTTRKKEKASKGNQRKDKKR